MYVYLTMHVTMTSSFHMSREIKLILKISMISHMSGFYVLGEVLSPNVSAPPLKNNFFMKKNQKLFQILILFDDDIKASVKVTNIQKCDFSLS